MSEPNEREAWDAILNQPIEGLLYDLDLLPEQIESDTERAAKRVISEMHKRLAEVKRERDLVIAHDRQPYPTAAAYEAVCTARTSWQARAGAAETKLAEKQKYIDEHYTGAATAYIKELETQLAASEERARGMREAGEDLDKQIAAIFWAPESDETGLTGTRPGKPEDFEDDEPSFSKAWSKLRDALAGKE